MRARYRFALLHKSLENLGSKRTSANRKNQTIKAGAAVSVRLINTS
jgi:hypothetical protein